MTITLTSKEFNEAVSLWLEGQGFNPDRYDISTRAIAGRSDGPLGTRLEVQLDPLSKYPYPIDMAPLLELLEDETPLEDIIGIPPTPTKKFGQGHADE